MPAEVTEKKCAFYRINLDIDINIVYFTGWHSPCPFFHISLLNITPNFRLKVHFFFFSCTILYHTSCFPHHSLPIFLRCSFHHPVFFSLSSFFFPFDRFSLRYPVHGSVSSFLFFILRPVRHSLAATFKISVYGVPSLIPFRFSQILILSPSFHLSFSFFHRGPPGGMHVSSSIERVSPHSNLLPRCDMSFTRKSRRASSIQRLKFETSRNVVVALYLLPISPIANLTSLSTLLNNRQISSVITLLSLPRTSALSLNRLYHLITFLWLFSPLIFPNPIFSRSPHRHVCSSRRHVADS